MSTPKFSVILAAAGQSQRFNDPCYKKPFVNLSGKPVWLHSAELFLRRSDVKQLLIVISPDDQKEFLSRFAPKIALLGIDVVLGGQQRSDSVENALAKVDQECDYVAIHDAARPCLDEALVDRVFQAATEHLAAVPAVPVHSTVKRSSCGTIVDETVDRSGLYLAQTPQVFQRKLIEELYAQRAASQFTDEAQLAEQHGVKVKLVPGSPLNIKITTKQDLALAQACIEVLPKPRFDAPLHPIADENLLR